MGLDWRNVSKQFFDSVQSNGVLKPSIHKTEVGDFDLGVAMAAASCIHPTHSEFGVTSGRPRVVGFFDLVAHAEAMAAQGPYVSISAFDRGDDYDEYGLCIAYVFQHPEGKSMVSNGRTFESGTIIKAGEQLPTQPILNYCHAIIKKVRGWRDTPIFAHSKWWQEREVPVELPEPICEMLDIIEQFTGSKVISIGNGPKGDQIIYISRKGRKKVAAKAKPQATDKIKERRVDPDDGVAYTFEEISAFYAGKFGKKAIQAYWDKCSPAKVKGTNKTKWTAKA
jgi:adenylosuccinate synthase